MQTTQYTQAKLILARRFSKRKEDIRQYMSHGVETKHWLRKKAPSYSIVPRWITKQQSKGQVQNIPSRKAAPV